MRQSTTYEDGTVSGSIVSGASTHREPPRSGTLGLIARAAAHDRISAALRAGRARAGLDRQEVVDLLRARGVSITRATLERWSTPAASASRRPSISRRCTT